MKTPAIITVARIVSVASVALSAAALILAMAGCGAARSHPAAAASASAKAHAAISALATSTAVAADKAQLRKDVAGCVDTGHVTTAETCLKGYVPPAKRHALETCLAKAAVAGWAWFKRAGAQACVTAALQ